MSYLFLGLMCIISLSSYCQVRCDEVIVWQVRLEAGKHTHTKFSADLLCKDSLGRIVEKREYGDGRELYYEKIDFDAQQRVIKEYYRHGFEGNDGGEGTRKYQYVGKNKTVIHYTAVNFSQKVEITHFLNSKKLIVKQVENLSSKSELLPDYNYKQQSTILYEYAANDSMAKKVVSSSDSKKTELFQFQKDLKIRYEAIHEQDKKVYMHQVTTYKYDDKKRLVEERTFDLPKYLTKFVKTITYKNDKIVDIQETDYEDFAQNKVGYQKHELFEYNEKDELLKRSYSYQYGNNDQQLDESLFTTEGDKKSIKTNHYKNKEKIGRTLEIQTLKDGRIRSIEVYKDGVLECIYEYEYVSK
ncbi:MAG: hypothetical protein MUE81_08770 [Thermoflexibacter sp.]|nr:hypothetical protein [Thermoflexibacter sp.]